jgi:hypothetical protein
MEDLMLLLCKDTSILESTSGERNEALSNPAFSERPLFRVRSDY